MQHFSNLEAGFTTVGELRQLIDGLDDKTPVSIDQIPNRAKVTGLCVLSTIGTDIQRPEKVVDSARHLVSAICICEVSDASPDGSIGLEELVGPSPT